MSSNLVIELRQFYMELVLSGFTEQQAFELTARRVPEMEEMEDGNKAKASSLTWADLCAMDARIRQLSGGAAGVRQHAAPISRPAQAESTT